MLNSEKTSVQDKYPFYLGLTGNTLRVWLTVACSIAMAFCGYDQGVIAGIIVSHDYLRSMGNPGSALLGTIVSVFNLGCFFGALSAFGYGGKLGRKKTLLAGVVIISIGTILQFSAFSASQMAVARLVTGFGNGMNTATAPIWQSETSKSRLRRRLLVFGVIMNVAGLSLGNWVAYGFSFASGNFSWRYSIAFGLFFSVILLSTVPWLPESPKWLLEHGYRDEGIRVLTSLEGPKATPQDECIVHQVEMILEAIRVERETTPTWKSLLRDKTCGNGAMKRLVLGAGIQWMQQFAGINAKNYYLPLVLQHTVGLSNNLARLLSACNSVLFLCFSCFGLLMVEKAGRRKFLILGATGQCICYILIPGFLSQSNTPKDGFELGGALTAFFFLYYSFFAMCWQGIPWLYPSEINGLAMQTKGTALGTATNWLLNYVLVQLTPIGMTDLNWRFYTVWAILNAIFVPLIWLFYPETSNRQPEDIDQLYQENERMVFVFTNKEAIQIQRPERFIEADRDRQRIEKETRPASGELSNTTDTTLVI